MWFLDVCIEGSLNVVTSADNSTSKQIVVVFGLAEFIVSVEFSKY